MIRRVRSEGDRRRAYVRLRVDDPIVAALGHGEFGPEATSAQANEPLSGLAKASRVVFVCTHNSARSQLAAAVWTRLSSVPTASAGTHPAGRVHPRAVTVGRRHGLRLSGAAPTRTDEVLDRTDLVVAVCDNAHEEHGRQEVPRARLYW